jgi:hypothetical protein
MENIEIDTSAQDAQEHDNHEIKKQPTNPLTTKNIHMNHQNHWTKEDWGLVEVKKSSHELRILNIIGSLGYNTQENEEDDEYNNYIIYGEDIYLANRPLLVKFGLVGSLPKSNITKTKDIKKKPKLSKADKIRYENSEKKSTEEFNKLLATFDDTKLNTMSGLQTNKVLELRGVTFIYIAWYFYKYKEQYMHKKNISKVYELIIGIQKFIKYTTNFVGKSIINSSNSENISSTLIIDLQTTHDKLIKIFKYDPSLICDINPKLFVECEYDISIPMADIKPYKSQIELMDTVKKNINNGFLISYKAMTNSGKTIMSVAIAQYIKYLRETTTNYKKLQVIYSCNSQSVQYDVCSNLYNMNIKFAYAFSYENGKIGISNNFNCKKDEDRIIIVCSPHVASELLKKDNSYLLFLDEPTIGADDKNINNIYLRDNMNAIINMPKWTILSSATNPDLSKLKPIINNYQDKYPEASISTVYSNEIFIGCDMYDYNNNIYLPHNNITSKKDLLSRLETINRVPFMGRLYTHRTLIKLINTLKENKITGLPELKTIFSEINNLKMNKIKELSLDILKTLENQDDNIIEKICYQEYKKDNIKFDNLGTTDAHKYLNINLVFTDDPVEFARTNFKSLLDRLKISEEKIESAKKLYEKYNKNYEQWIKSKNKITSKIKNQDKAGQELQSMNETAPILDFPQWAQINTLEHIKYYAKSHIPNIDPKTVRCKLILEKIPQETMASDDLILLLMCGVGIYTNDFKYIDKFYLEYIMKMASSGNLAYIIADSSLSYGANYPINRVIITPDFADNHSLDTIFQSISRAGRVGRSWMAESIIPDNLIMKIKSYLEDPNKFGDIEARNMIEIYNYLNKSKSEDYDLKKNKEHIVPISQILHNYNLHETKMHSVLPLDKPLFHNSSNQNKHTNWRIKK